MNVDDDGIKMFGMVLIVAVILITGLFGKFKLLFD